ncbi:PAS domain-containing sensor histidine kinase [Actinopolymorpha alba]|uniref:PAS domain-containing sensor histidine kinase n=1 Tax=Actinopolymorpha alba TaxID=533267 RepID=UPI00036BF10F|nr:PAS domain-containing sensor histidine kinase [Actinopolymorpha alba]
MPSLDDVVRQYTDLGDVDREWLHRLVAEWQMLADLSFADLVLWVPDREGLGFWACAQMRPTTGPTAHLDDLVGSFVPRGRRSLLDAAFDEGRICREGDPEWRDEVPVRIESIPVRRCDRVLGVITRNTNLLSVRTPSRLELTYLKTATDLAQMIVDGAFPLPGERVDLDSAPRVGDGLARLDPDGIVTYASPNAQSAYRRLGLTGDLLGCHLGTTTAELLPPSRRPVDEAISALISGRAPRETEIESGAAVVSMRVIPLVPKGAPAGALVLLRDVTDLRRRERELLTKEATIREIHHRVKNNLQTVAALLRLQARRLGTTGGREALEEAVRRVGTIAIVHETLSTAFEERVDFDEVADRVLAMVAEVSIPETRVVPRRKGSFGMLDAETATPLAMVITEVAQNAVQHGVGRSGGRVEVVGDRQDGKLRVVVEDDGRGLPDDFDLEVSGRLGLQIVRTLVESELGGQLTIGPGREGKGTRVVVDIPDVGL